MLWILMTSAVLAGPPTSFRRTDFGSECKANPAMVLHHREGAGTGFEIVVYEPADGNLNKGPIPLSTERF